ncbi:nitroreductase [Paenibacillus sp. IB182496]|uniref:Putative NAD(P)H nitroreductase n=1 Tax=Paenibacillus sabuli TaxID=2772509 RepID=A0A927BWR6_9BACL|nr:nitroreductase [Paenibacillus sabuli]MBD2848293.1 nitroreductase [Paenibacillus sabuli]
MSWDAIKKTIRERRTVNRFTGEPVPLSLIEELLDAAVWAPFHSRKEPWRFLLFLDDGRRRFSDAVLATYPADKRKQLGEQVAKAYCQEVPAHLVVLMEEEPRWKEWEEALSATSALIQNLQLLAWERGIGIVWKTNSYNGDPQFRAGVGVQPGQKVVGTLHMGYFDPATVRRAKPRTPVGELLTLVDG